MQSNHGDLFPAISLPSSSRLRSTETRTCRGRRPCSSSWRGSPTTRPVTPNLSPTTPRSSVGHTAHCCIVLSAEFCSVNTQTHLNSAGTTASNRQKKTWRWCKSGNINQSGLVQLIISTSQATLAQEAASSSFMCWVTLTRPTSHLYRCVFRQGGGAEEEAEDFAQLSGLRRPWRRRRSVQRRRSSSRRRPWLCRRRSRR